MTYVPSSAKVSDVMSSMAAGIVAAYVSKNFVPAAELPALIKAVHTALQRPNGTEAVAASVATTPQEPAVPVKKSITPDFIISLEDGKKFRSLKRHLMTAYGMTPQQYRTKWGLPPDYPMVAPNYAAQRSKLARQIGFGSGLRNKSQMSPGQKAA